MMLRRVLFALAFAALAAAASAQTGSDLLFFGVGSLGGGGAYGPLTPPSLTPQLSAAFDSNIANGYSNNGLKVNGGGAVGSMEFPTTQANSVFYTFEGSVDALSNLPEYPLAVLELGPANDGTPAFMMQTTSVGSSFRWWGGMTGVFPSVTTPISLGAGGSGYNSGIYPWTASGGGCAREPSGVWTPSVNAIAFTDPGFGCNAAPTIAPASIPGVGAQQAVATGATTCVPNSPITGEMTVTTTVAVAHGLYPAQTFPLSGFTGAGNTGYNATYTALAGTTGTTLVGETTTGGGTCPANSPDTSGGIAMSGTGATISIPAFSTTLPFSTNYGTGIVAKSNDKFCAVMGEYGADSATPGVAYMHVVDPNGNAFPGAPAVGPILNQGALNFTGYITNGAQDTNFTFTASFGTSGVASTTMTVTGTPGGTLAVGQTITGASIPSGTTIASLGTGSGGAGTYFLSTSNILPSQTSTAHTYAPALTVTAMASYSISAASWATGAFGNGQVTLTTTAAHPFIPGSVLRFSGFTGNWAALNGLQFIAQSGTNGATDTIVAGLYTGGASALTLANPGSYSSGAGSVAGTIEPNMYIPGVSGVVFISPYGTFASSGTGGVGTYGLTSNSEGGYSITGGITGTTLAITTVPGAAAYDWVAAGSGLATTGGVSSGTIIQSQSSGTAGAVGSYVVNNSQAISSGTVMATNGNVWSSGAPGNLYAANQFYNVVAPSYTAAYGGALTARTVGFFNDFFSIIGSKSSTAGLNDEGAWGGELANVGDHWGVFPQDTNGNPSTASLASLCEKTTDYQAFDTANGVTTKTLYRLNDPGVWGDSSIATIKGYLTSPSGTSGGTATLNVSSTVFGSLPSSGTFTIAGPGLPWNTTTPAWATVAGGAGPTYTVTFPTGVTSISLGSSGSPVQFSIGNWKPALPLGNAFVNGYITTSGGSGACASNPCLNVTSVQTGAGTLGATFTGTFNPALSTNNLTVSGVTGTIIIGQLITDGGASLTGPPLLISGGSGTTWTAYGGYYPSTITADSTMVGTLSTVNPGQLITGPGVSTPVQVVAYGSGTSLPAPGATYVLSNATNGNVGSSGSPVAFTLSSVTGGGAVAPGPALTINDLGAGTMFAVTNVPSSSPTGPIRVSGTYNTTSLGGTPSAIQAQLSLTPGGPAVAGFSWANLSSASIGAGAWSGSIANAPPGIYWVSVRAANGTAYATMQNFVTMAATFDYQGEGNAGAYFSVLTGTQNTIITGVNSVGSETNATVAAYGPTIGPFSSHNKYRINYTAPIPANRFTQQATGTLAEGATNFNQAFFNGSGGMGVGENNQVFPGVGSLIALLGNRPQTQTIGIGNGSQAAFCSSSIYCNVAASGIGSAGGGQLYYNAAGLTGATITGSVATAGGVSTLTVGAMITGAIEPGLTLSGAGVSGSPTLTACTSNCPYTTAAAGATSTWTLSSNQGTIGSQTFTLTPAGGAAWPNAYPQVGKPMAQNGAFGAQLIKFGTFSLSVNGTQVCSDTATFSYTPQGGQCSGAGIASSFINYVTGDYDIVFSSPPAANAIILASWTNLDSRNASGGYEQIDDVGDGTVNSGGWSSGYGAFPGGMSAHVYAGCVQDQTQFGFQSNYALGAIGLSQELSWFYGVRLPAIMPGQAANVPLLAFGMWRYQGPAMQSAEFQGNLICDQWFRDVSTPSTFTGTVTGGGTSNPILTLNSAVTGSLWEGEALGCNPYSTACSGMGGVTPSITLGTQITGILSGTWGANGSTYSLTSPSGPTGVVNVASQPMTNEAYYTGGPAYYIGPESDVNTQVENAAGIGGIDGHPWNGAFGGRRIGARAGILAAAALTNNPSLASEPTLSRTTIAACDAAALAAPCFDIGATYAATATTTSISGKVLTFNGLSANSRPIVDGQAVSCSGCNTGLFVVSVSNPPTQSTTAGAGQIGAANNGFTVTLNSTPGVSGAVAFTFGCSGVSGTGSNCIDFSFSLPTTGATSLATCGVNNMMGSAPIYSAPSGTCKDPGIGEWVNSFRIGTAQVTWVGSAGSPYFDGVDPGVGVGNQSTAFTCNIVAATVVQCVKAPAYTSGLPSGIGEWLSSGTYTSYGDSEMSAGRLGGLIGPAGGQSLGFTAGSGYTNGTYVLTGGSCGQATSFTAPKIDVTISGGAVVDVYPSAQTTTTTNAGTGITTNACTFPINFTFTGSSLSAVGLLTVTGTPSGALGIGSKISGGSLGSPITITSLGTGTGGAGTYNTSYSGSALGLATYTAGAPGGSGGAVSTMTYGPNQGAGGIASMISDTNSTGVFLYDNSGEPGNPLFSVFANPANSNTSYFEPGLPVQSWGQSIGARVGG